MYVNDRTIHQPTATPPVSPSHVTAAAAAERAEIEIMARSALRNFITIMQHRFATRSHWTTTDTRFEQGVWKLAMQTFYPRQNQERSYVPQPQEHQLQDHIRRLQEDGLNSNAEAQAGPNDDVRDFESSEPHDTDRRSVPSWLEKSRQSHTS
jgi:hypothetical protein